MQGVLIRYYSTRVHMHVTIINCTYINTKHRGGLWPAKCNRLILVLNHAIHWPLTTVVVKYAS